MTKVVKVLYSYIPRNEDELKIDVGDMIEVVGHEEEGWWRGRLNGRIGVFPSNFVEVLETTSALNQNIKPLNLNTQLHQPNSFTGKLNQITNKLAKSEFSSNNSSFGAGTSSGLFANNQSRTTNIMDHANQDPDINSTTDAQNNGTSSERRLKPIRGVGYGDIFSAGKPKLNPVDFNSSSNERLSSSLTSPIQKPIPKKPPPPTPIEDNNISTTSDQGPPTPPKPMNNQFISNLQRHQSNTTREQAKVMFPYKAANEDELTLVPGDVIDIISKEIEDPGWWHGELNGKIGVFPDNFVELIKPQVQTQEKVMPSKPSSSFLKSIPQTSTAPFNNEFERTKSVLASTSVSNFSKDLEESLERNGNQTASFHSLNRNKLHQLSLPNRPRLENFKGDTLDDSQDEKKITNGVASTNMNSLYNSNGVSDSTKLHHMTANRAKGPARRPPSNVMSKRSQSEYSSFVPDASTDDNIVTKSAIKPQTVEKVALKTEVPKLNKEEQRSENPTNSKFSIEGVINDHNTSNINTPKAFQRSNQLASSEKPPVSGSPQWMVELKKAQAEKKKDIAAPTTKSNTIDATIPNDPNVRHGLISSTPAIQAAATIKQPHTTHTQIDQVKASTIANDTNAKPLTSIPEYLAVQEELNKLRSEVADIKRHMKELVSLSIEQQKKMASILDALV